MIKFIAISIFIYAHIAHSDSYPYAEYDLAPGESVFEQVLLNQSKKNKIAIPYPYEKLLGVFQKKLSNKNETSVLFIPYGRSLQRFAAKPDFFKFPRVVSTFFGVSKNKNFQMQSDLFGKLFIAYVEPTNKLEVIAFNEQRGRFEFILVENYAKGLTPEIVHPKRELCTSCHQGQVPIFSSEPWSETNDNDAIADFIIAARKSKTYLGQSIKLNNMPGRAFSKEVNKFDLMVDRANKLVRDRIFRQKICSGSQTEVISCRASMLAMSLANFYNYFPGSEDAAWVSYQKYVNRFFTENTEAWLNFPFLSDRNPFTNEQVEDEKYIDLKPKYKNIEILKKRMLDNLENIPTAHDPKAIRYNKIKLHRQSCFLPAKEEPKPHKKWCLTKYFYSIFHHQDLLDIWNQILKQDSKNVTKIIIALEKMRHTALHSPKNSALGTPVLQRELLLKELFFHLIKKDYKLSYNAAPASSKEKLIANSHASTPPKNRFISALRKACYSCHGQEKIEYPIQFLQNESDLKTHKEAIINCLENNSAPMPPLNSKESEVFNELGVSKKELINYMQSI